MDTLPQLRMRNWLRSPLPVAQPLSACYRLREAGLEDAVGLAQVLTSAFGEPWDPARVRAELLDHPDVPTTYVIDEGVRIVATASYQLQPNEFPTSGWLHWVGTDPEHSGRGLGKALTIRVLQRSVDDGRTDVGLTTDDRRLPAIAAYLKCGFEPDPWHLSHPERWRTVHEALAAYRPRST